MSYTLKNLKSIVFLIVSVIVAENGFPMCDSLGLQFDLSVRYRMEIWDGMNARNYGDDSEEAIGELDDKILYQRVIAGFTYRSVKKLNFAFHIQDSRAFGWSLRNSLYHDLFKVHGSDPTPYFTMNPAEEYFEIYDAFVESDQLVSKFSFKLGRQKIFYGDNHIFGPGDWGNSGRWTWDAFKVSYKSGKNFVDLFAGGTKIHDPVKITVPFTQTQFWGCGMYAHIPVVSQLTVEPFYAYKTAGSADYANSLNLNRHWTGIRVFNNNFHHALFDLTAVNEFGNENGKSIKAYGFFAKIGYQFHTLPARPILSLRETYASGGKKDDKTIRTFDPAYGAGDKYYGWMNITSWTNLDDREIVLELFPVKDMWVEMKLNRFYIPVPEDAKILGTMKLESGKNHLGDEFNIFVRYQLDKQWQITGAFGYFFAGDLVPINNKPPEDAKWLALQVLFTLH